MNLSINLLHSLGRQKSKEKARERQGEVGKAEGNAGEGRQRRENGREGKS